MFRNVLKILNFSGPGPLERPSDNPAAFINNSLWDLLFQNLLHKVQIISGILRLFSGKTFSSPLKIYGSCAYGCKIPFPNGLLYNPKLTTLKLVTYYERQHCQR